MGLPMLERHSTALRVISVVAGTVISLACGTNYAYSAWAPQFSRRLVFNSTQSNLIGTAANFGMYLCGVPIGMLIDAKGPRTGALLGAALLGVGYAGLYLAYVRGPGSIHIAVLCFFAALTGVGGASAFFGSIKTATVNWPTHRGTATAFPIAAFGLSAFLFSLIGGLAFHGDAAGLLLLFAIGTTLMILLSTYFLQIVPLAPQYAEVPTDPEPDVEERDGGRLHGLSDVYHGPLSERTTYTLRSPGHPTEEPRSSSQARLLRKSPDLVPLGHTDDDEFDDASERKSLSKGNSVYGEVHGIRMLKHSEFYEFWILLGSMTGIGLMTINNIGNDAQALWSAWDKTTTDDWIEKQQKAYVSIISFTSFIGRLSSGIGSDFIAMKLHKSRFWCLFASSLVFCLAQVVAILAENPNLLALLSGCNGRKSPSRKLTNP